MQSLWVNDDLCLTVEQRDAGPSLHVILRTPARPPIQETRRFQEIVRFDCFKDAPHYHVFNSVFASNNEAIHDLSKDWDITTSVERCLQACTENFPLLLREAGYEQLIPVLRGAMTAEHVALLRGWMLRQ